MVMNRPSNNNANGGVDTETTRDVLNRLDRTIRVLEGELAKPNPFGTRAALQGQLREAKALKASLNSALVSGAITLNQPLFNNRGMPTAKPGSFLEAVLKRAEATFGLFSNQFGPKTDPFGFEKGEEGSPFFKKEPGLMFNQGFGPKAEPGFGPEGRAPDARAPKPPPYFMNLAKQEGAVKGNAGTPYPGLPNYIFGLDQTTPVQKVAGRPVPGSWPHPVFGRMVYDESLQPVVPTQGNKVPGTEKTYYGANPIDMSGEMVYPDGTYTGALAIPPSASTITSKQASANQLYIPKAGDPVQGALVKTHVHDDSKSASPTRFETAGNIPWIGTGTSHVFKSDGTPLQKQAGVVVPGQTSQVYSEALQAMEVKAGIFVPGSGVHSRGGNIRQKVYTSTSPSEQLTWSAGADAPWDGDASTRFNIDGQLTKFAAGQAYPGQANQVFDTDFSAYTKAAGKEVPGSSGYDRTDPETGDADGLGPAKQVYDAALRPINKVRGLQVPGQARNRIYSQPDEITTVEVGGQVLDPDGGFSFTEIYSSTFDPVRVQKGLFKPVANTNQRHAEIFTSPFAPEARSLRTVSDPGTVDIAPGDPGFIPAIHQLSLLPIGNLLDEPPGLPGGKPGAGDGTVKTDAGFATPFVFDPAFSYEGQPVQQRIGTPLTPAVLFLPGTLETIEKEAAKGRQIPLAEIYVSALPETFGVPITADSFSKSFAPMPFEHGIDAGIVDASFAPTRSVSIQPGGFDAKASTVRVAPGLDGSRSLMYKQGFGASTSTTSSSRSSGGFRNFMNDPRAGGRWF